MFELFENSVLIGKGNPTLAKKVRYVSEEAAKDGLYHALQHLGFM